jgi:hypothetical protein
MESTKIQSIPNPKNGATTVGGNNDDDESHRRVFMELSFGARTANTSPSEQIGHKTMLSVEEHQKFIQTLRYWNIPGGHVEETTGRHISTIEFRRSLGNRTWYATSKSYRINTFAKNGENIEVLERRDPNDNVWKQVVHEGNVYDAIKEAHLNVNHMKVSRTKKSAEKVYWNITEQLCRNFVRTCPKCNQKSANETAVQSIRNDKESNAICKRYCISIIDFSRQPQKNVYGIEMRYILLVYDEDTNWMMLRPIPNLEKKIIESELVTLICIKGHHRFQGDHSIESAASILTQGALQRLQNDEQGLADHQDSNRIFTLENEVYVTMQLLKQEKSSTAVTDEANWVQLLPQTMMYMNSSSKNFKKSLRLTKGVRRIKLCDQAIMAKVDDRGNIFPKSDLTNTQQPAHLDDTPTKQQQTKPPSPKLPEERPFNNNLNNIRLLPNPETSPIVPDQLLITQQLAYPGEESHNPQQMKSPPKPQEKEPPIKNLNKETTNEDVNLIQSMNYIPNEIEISSNVPQSQDTLSRIDELLKKTGIAHAVKEIYKGKNMSIRSFFDTKPMSEVDEKEDEVEIISPPLKSEYENAIFSKSFTELTIRQAFDLGITTWTLFNGEKHPLCHPRLICMTCTEPSGPPSVTIAEENYYCTMEQTNIWFTVDMVCTFGILCAHDAHREDIMYTNCPLPTITPKKENKKPVVLSPETKTIVSVVFTSKHFAIMRLCLEEKTAYYYDGLSWPVNTWSLHTKHVLNKYGLEGKWKKQVGTGENGLEGVKIHQDDQSNCGPIACIVLWKLFKPKSVDIHIDHKEYRATTMEELKRLITYYDSDLVVLRRQRGTSESDDDSNTNLGNNEEMSTPSSPEGALPKAVRLFHTPPESALPSPRTTPKSQNRPNEKTTFHAEDTSKTENRETNVSKARETEKTCKNIETNRKTKRKDILKDDNYGLCDMNQIEREDSSAIELKDVPEAPTVTIKKRKIVESPSTEGGTPSPQNDLREINASETLLKNGIHKHRLPQLFSGLSDSEKEEEEMRETITTVGLGNVDITTHAENETKARNAEEKGHGNHKKPRIKIPKKKMDTSPKTIQKRISKNCQCKGKCNKACGCRKQGRLCSTKCACMADCNNNNPS